MGLFAFNRMRLKKVQLETKEEEIKEPIEEKEEEIEEVKIEEPVVKRGSSRKK